MGSDSCPPRLADEVGTRMGVEVDDHLRRVRVRARARAGVRDRVRVGSGLGLGPGLGFVSVFGFRLGFLPPVAPGVNHGQVAHTAIGGMRGAVWRAWLGLELELGLGLATPKP